MCVCIYIYTHIEKERESVGILLVLFGIKILKLKTRWVCPRMGDAPKFLVSWEYDKIFQTNPYRTPRALLVKFILPHRPG